MKKLNALREKLKINKKYFIFLFILFVISIVAGSIFGITLNNNDKELVNIFLDNYINSIKDNTIVFKTTFFNSITSNYLITIFIWLLGISVIGIPIILFLFFYKCFVLGFAISTILLKYKVKGILLSIIYVIPHHIINILLLIILISYAFNMSISIIKAVLKKREINFKDLTSKYFFILAFNCFLIVFLSLYESFIVPKLISQISSLLI